MNEQTNRDWRKQFDDRQIKEIVFSIYYATEFAHGTDGHNAKMIIAKMAQLLDNQYIEIKKREDPGAEELEILAREAYHAYGKSTNFLNYQGLPMPEWERLTPTINAAWKEAVLAVDRNVR